MRTAEERRGFYLGLKGTTPVVLLQLASAVCCWAEEDRGTGTGGDRRTQGQQPAPVEAGRGMRTVRTSSNRSGGSPSSGADPEEVDRGLGLSSLGGRPDAAVRPRPQSLPSGLGEVTCEREPGWCRAGDVGTWNGRKKKGQMKVCPWAGGQGTWGHQRREGGRRAALERSPEPSQEAGASQDGGAGPACWEAPPSWGGPGSKPEMGLARDTAPQKQQAASVQVTPSVFTREEHGRLLLRPAVATGQGQRSWSAWAGLWFHVR